MAEGISESAKLRKEDNNMDIFKKQLAPITAAAWSEIEEQAKMTLTENLSARAIVDLTGPLGWETSAVNLGGVSLEKSGVIDGVNTGMRKVKPLIEVKVDFSLSVDEMDAVSRGKKDPDLDALEDAAKKIAHFEEKAIYNGFDKGGIQGIIPSSEFKAIQMKKSPAAYPEAIEDAIAQIHLAGIKGPYHIILGNEPYKMMMQGDERGYPVRKHAREILGGEIYWSPALKGGIVISGRGGDFEFTLGQDLSIGYNSHDAKKVNLYFTETFTFQVLEPRAAIALNIKSK